MNASEGRNVFIVPSRPEGNCSLTTFFHGVKQVEISTDGGRTWNNAIMDPPMSPFSWMLWNYPWRIPKPDVYALIGFTSKGRSIKILPWSLMLFRKYFNEVVPSVESS